MALLTQMVAVQQDADNLTPNRCRIRLARCLTLRHDQPSTLAGTGGGGRWAIENRPGIRASHPATEAYHGKVQSTPLTNTTTSGRRSRSTRTQSQRLLKQSRCLMDTGTASFPLRRSVKKSASKQSTESSFPHPEREQSNSIRCFSAPPYSQLL